MGNRIEEQQLGGAPCATIRLRPLEAGARVTTWMRRIEGTPGLTFRVQARLARVLEQLRTGRPSTA
jgi:hypothetical protein